MIYYVLFFLIFLSSAIVKGEEASILFNNEKILPEELPYDVGLQENQNDFHGEEHDQGILSIDSSGQNGIDHTVLEYENFIIALKNLESFESAVDFDQILFQVVQSVSENTQDKYIIWLVKYFTPRELYDLRYMLGLPPKNIIKRASASRDLFVAYQNGLAPLHDCLEQLSLLCMHITDFSKASLLAGIFACKVNKAIYMLLAEFFALEVKANQEICSGHQALLAWLFKNISKIKDHNDQLAWWDMMEAMALEDEKSENLLLDKLAYSFVKLSEQGKIFIVPSLRYIHAVLRHQISPEKAFGKDFIQKLLEKTDAFFEKTTTKNVYTKRLDDLNMQDESAVGYIMYNFMNSWKATEIPITVIGRSGFSLNTYEVLKQSSSFEKKRYSFQEPHVIVAPYFAVLVQDVSPFEYALSDIAVLSLFYRKHVAYYKDIDVIPVFFPIKDEEKSIKSGCSYLAAIIGSGDQKLIVSASGMDPLYSPIKDQPLEYSSNLVEKYIPFSLARKRKDQNSTPYMSTEQIAENLVDQAIKGTPNAFWNSLSHAPFVFGKIDSRDTSILYTVAEKHLIVSLARLYKLKSLFGFSYSAALKKSISNDDLGALNYWSSNFGFIQVPFSGLSQFIYKSGQESEIKFVK